MASLINPKAFDLLVELPLPDVPVCKRLHRDEEVLRQPVDQQFQPPQGVTKVCYSLVLFRDE